MSDEVKKERDVLTKSTLGLNFIMHHSSFIIALTVPCPLTPVPRSIIVALLRFALQ